MTDVDMLLRQAGAPPRLPVDETALRMAVTTGRTRRRLRGGAAAGASVLAVVGMFAVAQPFLVGPERDRVVVADGPRDGRPAPATHGPERPAPEPPPGGMIAIADLPEGRFPPPGPTVPVVAADPGAQRQLAAYTFADGRSCLALREPFGGALNCRPSIDPNGVTVWAAGPVFGGAQTADRLAPPATYGTVPESATSIVITNPGGSEEFAVVDGGPASVNYYLTRHQIDGPTVVAAYNARGELVASSDF